MKPTHLVAVHYHLNRGGVTSVIRNHLKALAATSQFKSCLVLHGVGTEGWNPESASREFEDQPLAISFREIEDLGYCEDGRLIKRLHQQIQSAIEDHEMDPVSTLIHIHNHNLGKNSSLMMSVDWLTQQGYSILLQIHDFAEDMRPNNYRAIQDFCEKYDLEAESLIFPNNPKVHFAFLNQRDLKLVSNRFVDGSRCHLLPNPVLSSGETQAPVTRVDEPTPRSALQQEFRDHLGVDPDERLVLYPVRAIRRKNIGEAMLFASVNKGVKLAITLPAVSNEEMTIYEAFKKAAYEWSLPVRFEVGTMGYSFNDMIAAADCLFTSSVAEGFGMVFLESWLMGKALVGRNLDGITSDFVEEGLDLEQLYDEVQIPLEWIDLDVEQARQQQLLEIASKSYGLESAGEIQFKLERERGTIDFAKLGYRTQLKILDLVRESSARQETILDLNPLFQIPVLNSELLEKNRDIVLREFAGDRFCQRFDEIVNHLFGEHSDDCPRITESCSLTTLVRNFLDPDHLFPIRMETGQDE